MNQVRWLNRENNVFFKIKFGRILKQVITAINEMITDHATQRTVIADTKTLVNAIRAQLVGDYLDEAPGLDIGSTKPNVLNTAFEFHVNGDSYTKAAVAAGTALAGDNIPQSLYGAFALDIGINKTVDIIPAADNATGYASAVLALVGIPAVGADHLRMGTVSVIKVDVDFLNSAPTLAIGTTNTKVSHVEFTHWHAQAEKTEPALAAGATLTGDTVPQNKYGAFRFEIGADETLDLVPADDNVTGYDSAVLALADLPAVGANHAVVGTFTVINTDVAGFIPGTTALDAGTVTVVYADGALDGFFIPGTTELDDGEVTDVYADGTVGMTIPAAVSTSPPAVISAGAVDDIEGEIDD